MGACTECGSDAGTGWAEEASDWTGDLPSGYGDDPDFDYEEALRSEGLRGTVPCPAGCED